ncbi:MAG: hypothetical protein ACXAEF_01875 [Candidatus Thorarchaeota archaeon]|jgi:hypothetical protein
MGTYVETYDCPCGHDEIKRRFNEWLKSEGARFRVYEKEDARISIVRDATGGGEIHLKLYLRASYVEVEGYVIYPEHYLKRTKPVSPKGFFGAVQT